MPSTLVAGLLVAGLPSSETGTNMRMRVGTRWKRCCSWFNDVQVELVSSVPSIGDNRVRARLERDRKKAKVAARLEAPECTCRQTVRRFAAITTQTRNQGNHFAHRCRSVAFCQASQEILPRPADGDGRGLAVPLQYSPKERFWRRSSTLF
jgi:hypothetical protein